MCERNLHDLHNKLTEVFINYQWRLDHPMPEVGETMAMRIACYHNDQLFHAKVASLTAMVSHIVMDWLKEGRD